VGDLQHCDYVRAAVPLRLVPGNGVAAVRTYHGALVVAEERGGIVSVWNCAHNVGGGIPPLLFLLGMAWFNDWHAALYMPAFGAIWWRLLPSR
jgi:sugar phosphate permease